MESTHLDFRTTHSQRVGVYSLLIQFIQVTILLLVEGVCWFTSKRKLFGSKGQMVSDENDVAKQNTHLKKLKWAVPQKRVTH